MSLVTVRHYEVNVDQIGPDFLKTFDKNCSECSKNNKKKFFAEREMRHSFK